VKRYEGLFILNTAAKEEGIKDVIDKISTEITNVGGKVETVQKMDRKNFMRVADKKHTAGFYVNVIFSAVAEQVRAERRGLPRAVHALARAQAREVNENAPRPWPVSIKSSSPGI